MLNRRALLITTSAALAALMGIILSASPGSILTRAELFARDFIARHGRSVPANPKLMFLAIDSDSISLDAQTDLRGLFEIPATETPEGQALSLMTEHWPWPRSVYALVLERLVAAGASSVVFDLNFPTPSNSDEEFRAALDRFSDRVVIGSNFTLAGGDDGRIDASHTLPTDTLIPATGVPDPRVGFVNFWPDGDGVIRSAHFQMNFAQFLGSDKLAGEATYTSLAAQAVRKLGRPDLATGAPEEQHFRYTAGPGQGFPPRSIFEIFVPEYWTRNFGNGALFDGAVVVVGAAGNWQHDEHLTPFGVMSGPEIQLNVINAIMHQDFLTPLSRPAVALIQLAAGALAAWVSLAIAAPLRRIAVLLGIGVLWMAVQLPLFNHAGLLAPVVAPLAILGIVGIFALNYDLAIAWAEQIRLRLRLQERKRLQEFLEQANAELENKVAARTLELTQTNEKLTSSLHEKEVLLKEVHHRVKNNLQVISSLLNLQSAYIKDPVALQSFTESRNRVRSMALIHEKLYQSQDLARIDFEDYIKSLSSGLTATFAGKTSRVRIAADVDQVMLPVDSAVPCGLIVNELVTNCFKYAFKPEVGGEIRIGMKRLDGGLLRLSVADNGVGFPEDLDIRNTESLGMQLVTTLADQLEGTIALRSGSGAIFELTFAEQP